MREIKFRGWSGKVMIDLKRITPIALSDNMNTDGLFLPFLDNLPLMQYTGVQDKNGTEIYEGDILRFKTKWDCETWRVEQVRFGDGSFHLGFVICMYHTQIDEHQETRTTMEVIGNIHENPELLQP